MEGESKVIGRNGGATLLSAGEAGELGSRWDVNGAGKLLKPSDGLGETRSTKLVRTPQHSSVRGSVGAAELARKRGRQEQGTI